MNFLPQLFVLLGEFQQAGVDSIELLVDGDYA